jgi:hypothetical protein
MERDREQTITDKQPHYGDVRLTYRFTCAGGSARAAYTKKPVSFAEILFSLRVLLPESMRVILIIAVYGYEISFIELLRPILRLT